MSYAVIADSLVVLHGLFIVFVVLGGLLAIWRRWLVFAHLPALAWAAYIEFSGAICPLTPLENHYRKLAGEAGYSGGFIEHYLEPVIYPAGLTPDIQYLLGGLLLLFNLAVYSYLWRR